MKYNFDVPLAIFGGLIVAFVLITTLFYVFVRKVTFTPPHDNEQSYYEPRIWAIVVAIILAILFLGFSK